MEIRWAVSWAVKNEDGTSSGDAVVVTAEKPGTAIRVALATTFDDGYVLKRGQTLITAVRRAKDDT